MYVANDQTDFPNWLLEVAEMNHYNSDLCETHFPYLTNSCTLLGTDTLCEWFHFVQYTFLLPVKKAKFQYQNQKKFKTAVLLSSKLPPFPKVKVILGHIHEQSAHYSRQ